MHNFYSRRVAAENALLAAAVFGQNSAEILASVEPNTLTPDTAETWKTCRGLLNEHGQLTLMELTIAPGVSEETLAAVIGFKDAASSSERRLQTVRAVSAVDKVMGLLRTTLGMLDEKAVDSQRASETMLSLAGHLQTIARQLDMRDESRLLKAAMERAIEQALKAEDGSALSTGIPDLDIRIGGLKPGTMCVVVGKSGHGKSSLALTAALRAGVRGDRVLYISREMERSELAWRFAAAALDQSIGTIQHDAKHNAVLRAELIERADLPIDIDDKLGHIDAVCSLIESEFHKGSPYKLVILDFLQIMQADGDEQHLRLESMAYAAKSVSMRCECAVIALVQPNRAGSKVGVAPTMHDIRGSSAIENAADSVVAIYRGDPMGPGEPYPFAFTVEKARNGQPGELAGTYHLGAGTFRVVQTRSENENIVAKEAIA